MVAGCGRNPVRKLAGSAADLPRLRELLEIERAEVAMFELGLRRLDARALPLARAALAHERAHADALAEAIRELGGSPPAPRDPSAYTRSMPRTARAYLEALARFEDRVVSSYALRIPETVNARLRGTLGAALTTEAEHAAALGALR